MQEITPTTNNQFDMLVNDNLISEFIGWIDRTDRTSKAYKSNLRQFFAYLYYTNQLQPTKETIKAYRDYLLTEHEAIQLSNNDKSWCYRLDKSGQRIELKLKPKTVKAYMQVVQSFFYWTSQHGIYPNMASNVNLPKTNNTTHSKQSLKPYEVADIESQLRQRIVEADNPIKLEQTSRDLALYLLAVNAGLRTVELARLDIKDIELISGEPFIYVWGKGHAEADTRQAISTPVYKAVKEYVSCRTDAPTLKSPLFVATGNRSKGQRLASTTISTMLKKMLVSCGYDSERITAHSLRHTAGTTTQAMTNDLYTTQQYLRHSSPATTEIYLHSNNDTKLSSTANDLYNYYHDCYKKPSRSGAEKTKSEIIMLLDKLEHDQLEELKSIIMKRLEVQ